MMEKIPVGIIGISGYTGLELFKILSLHPLFEVTYVANSSGQGELASLHPKLKHICQILGSKEPSINKADPIEASLACELLFLALPHQESMIFAKKALQNPKVRIIDLSADYRLEAHNYAKNYCEHEDLENLKSAIYGLTEFNAQKIKDARLVANPGCYPTASLLALLPFINLVSSSVFIDAKSGVSGAGKKLTDNTHYPHINENIFAYSPLKHRHQIEIFEKCQQFLDHQDLSPYDGAHKPCPQIHFIPHLTPLTQGMLVSIFATLQVELDPILHLREFYKDSPFIRICENPVDVLNVRGSNFCDIYAAMSGKDIYISSSIDNLLRGASAQAVANANLMYGYSPTLGIPLF